MTTERSPEELAAVLLQATGLEALRREVGRNKAWAKAFGGFRPQSLTHPMAAGKAATFSRDPALMRSLVTVYLKHLGMPEHGSIEQRLNAAAARTGLSEEVRDTCAQLSRSGGTATAAEASEVPAAEEGPAAVEVEVEAAALPAPKARRRAPAKPK